MKSVICLISNVVNNATSDDKAYFPSSYSVNVATSDTEKVRQTQLESLTLLLFRPKTNCEKLLSRFECKNFLYSLEKLRRLRHNDACRQQRKFIDKTRLQQIVHFWLKVDSLMSSSDGQSNYFFLFIFVVLVICPKQNFRKHFSLHFYSMFFPRLFCLNEIRQIYTIVMIFPTKFIFPFLFFCFANVLYCLLSTLLLLVYWLHAMQF